MSGRRVAIGSESVKLPKLPSRRTLSDLPILRPLKAATEKAPQNLYESVAIQFCRLTERLSHLEYDHEKHHRQPRRGGRFLRPSRNPEQAPSGPGRPRQYPPRRAAAGRENIVGHPTLRKLEV